MGQVNSDVQSTIDNTNALYQAILDLWTMTPIELKMYIGIMFTLSILMQYIKKAFLINCTKRERVRKLWIYSFPLGVSLAVVGHSLYGNKIHIGYFILTGLTVSTVSMGIHRVAVNYIYPGLKMVVTAVWTRIILIVRGKSV